MFFWPSSGNDRAFEPQLSDLSGIPLVVAEWAATLNTMLQRFVFEFRQRFIDVFQPATALDWLPVFN